MTLIVRDLTVSYGPRGVSFSVADGETVALVGESGSGKSTLIRAVLGALPRSAEVEGAVELAGRNLIGLPEKELRALRGREIGYVAQDPFGSADPLWTVGHHVREAWRVHGERPPAVETRLKILGVADKWLKRRPQAWSGGMLQRADIVAATAHAPTIVLADEPTSALDAEIAETALATLVAQTRSLLIASHDLALVCRHADRVLVLHKGELVEDITVERGGVEVLKARARHPHTRALVDALPTEAPRRPRPTGEVVVRLDNVTLGYRGTELITGLDWEIRAGEAVGICGPSGSGKTTLLHAIAGLVEPMRGAISRSGRVMPVFQDATASLNPRWPVWRTITEPMKGADARELMDRVGLTGVELDRKPAQLSGGQRQRVAIARALAGSPALIIADEPTASLDPTVAASVAETLRAVTDSGCALVVVSHDEARLNQIVDRVHRLDAVTSGS
ncbi:ATP-binding cassette domain-containing protein [Allokutzneria sp. A3M-2-11 16]|uniref:ABC transporter ATP-binding protein n=1 Tax=Allokutzneria sp. A3M-2-11 16 TaxID=2962043 RepID=UPI0020B714A1|nr:ATP-binding cassette domain-containing protein [Allokutzneria sp. A3M-2-11 16]MCP3803589.1 ATP-binding cassette domain-containing protein [Allokutzneria sp. A3M-2-11 16]